MRTSLYLVLFATLLFAVPAIAQSTQEPSAAPAAAAPPSSTGGPSAVELIKLCLESAASGSVSNAVCTGYLAGFIGALRIAETVSEDFPICLPEHGLTNLQVVNDVSSYLEQNQDQLQRSARSVFFLEIGRASCRARVVQSW